MQNFLFHRFFFVVVIGCLPYIILMVARFNEVAEQLSAPSTFFGWAAFIAYWSFIVTLGRVFAKGNTIFDA